MGFQFFGRENIMSLNYVNNEYLISKKNKVFIHTEYNNTELNPKLAKLVYAFIADIQQLGFKLSPALFDKLFTLSRNSLVQTITMLTIDLRTIVGAHVKYKPLFRNFPNDVPEEYDYLIRRIFGFFINLETKDSVQLSCGHNIDPKLFNLDHFNACPVCQMQVPELGNDETKIKYVSHYLPFRELDLMDVDGLKETFRNIVAAKSSISEEDRKFVANVIDCVGIENIQWWLPETIPFKENLGFVIGVLFGVSKTSEYPATYAKNFAKKHIKTVTDVLRLAVQLSDGDITLATPTKFKLSNSYRKVILALLENVVNNNIKMLHTQPIYFEELLKYRGQWLALAKHVHVGAQQKRFPKSFEVLNTLRNDYDSIRTFNGYIQSWMVKSKGLSNKERLDNILAWLQTKPGVFARQLNELLVKFEKPSHHKKIVESFTKVMDQVTTKSMLTLMKYFQNRPSPISNFDTPVRIFLPKGNVSKTYIINDERPVISSITCDHLVKRIKKNLVNRFSELPSLGKNTYIDTSLMNVLVPMAQRTASKTSNPMIRGSRVELEQTSDFFRFFMYWKENDESGRIDVDLSAAFFDKNFNYCGHASWTALAQYGCQHSGDIQSAPQGASEFIDIDVEKLKANGIAYVVANVYSYTGQSFDSFDCFAGVMERTAKNTNELYDPTTLKCKFDITTKQQAAIPLIIDIRSKEMIWVDIASTGRTIEASASKVIRVCKGITDMVWNVPTMYELLELHGIARSKIFYDNRKRKYDTVYDMGMLQNIDTIVANYL